MTNNDMKSSLKKYYAEISKSLPRKNKKKILSEIKAGVDSYLADNHEATIDDVKAFVGSSECLIDEYYANESGTEINKKIKFGKKAFFIVLVAVIIAFVIFMLTMLTFWISAYRADHGYFIESEIVSSHIC